jgi:hypothetical protein
MADAGIPRYDRDFLLNPAKRDQIVELWEVEKFGRDSFGDPGAVSLYGMPPAQWHARGVRILARTALEAVRDPLGNRIGEDVARVAATAPPGSAFGVVDPFAGSCTRCSGFCNICRERKGLGFEFEQVIFDMTARNIASLGAPIRLLRGDYSKLLDQHRFPGTHRIAAFLAPPWADALSAQAGLDLGRTKPPIGRIVDYLERIYSSNPILYVTEVHERLVPGPLAALRSRFEWSELNVYDIPGRLDDTECCSAPSVGVRRMLQPRGSLFSWIALPRSLNLKLDFRESGHARGQPSCRIKSGAANSRNGTWSATPPHDGYPLPD